MQNWILKPAASSLAPSDKYHKTPQGGHRHTTTSATSSEGGGETNNTANSNNHPVSANNNHHFSHNGIPPPFSSASSSGAATENIHPHQYDSHLMQSSSYHFYPSNSVGSSSISSSSHHHQQPLALHQPPYLYKSNHSSSGGSYSGNGSHIIIDGSNNCNGGGSGSAVEGSDNKKYYYYYNGHYYPATAAEEEDPDQIFTITAFTSGSGSGKQIVMGRVGEDMYPPGSPASVGKGNGGTVGLFKSKSSSIPVTSGSPQPHQRGFRDTFISNMSPPVQTHSAEASPLHRSASAATTNSSDRYSNSVAGGNNKQENKKWSFGGLFRRNKAKSTAAAAAAAGNNNSIVVENGGASSANNSQCNSPAKINNNYGSGSPIIIPNSRNSAYSPARPASSVGFISVSGQSENHHHRPNTFISSSTPKFVNAESQTRAKGKLSESDISTCDSDFELTHHHNNPPEPAPQENKGYKQNFLVRRLSRRKEKAAAKKAAAQVAADSASPKTGAASGSNHQLHHNSSNGFISSQHGCHDVGQMKRRVGSSPDSLNNSSEPWPSWETTKKPQQTQLQALQQQHRLLQNYSSNGSLSVSQEGYNSNNNSSNNHGSKSSRAAVKEAVKARAIARRESFLNDSSSSDDDDTEEKSQRSSLQGSFTSLNSRNRRQRAFNMQQREFVHMRHLFPAAAGGGISCASPSSPVPMPLDYRSSPKWEARVMHDGESSNQAVVARLPRKERISSGDVGNPGQMSQNNGAQSFIMATEMISEDQNVVTAGLKVPFLPNQQQPLNSQDQQCLRNGQFPDDPVQYANVANGMRGRSCTPYMGYNNGAIHHASPTPPPPPPPRRDFTTATNNPNFYRPVSCSYLDSYANQLQMTEQQRQPQQSPMIFNGNYIYSPQQQQYQGQQQEFVMNGFASHSTNPAHNFDGARGIARSSPRHFVPGAGAPKGNNNQPDADGARHPPLIRSPSEPPVVIRGEQTRISSPVKRLISSPNGSNGESQAREGKQSPTAAKSVITSKLGFPVRRLQETSKLAGSQTPVHLRASEFWRRRESEVTGSLSPVGAASVANNQQKKYLNRIRSADSSPLPVPKMKKSPGGVVASNESISSLSSFSENAASPGPPKNCSSPIANAVKQGGVQQKATPIRAQLSKTPNPQQLTYGNNSKDRENNNTQPHQQSAVERLKVRTPSAPDGIKSSNNTSNLPCSSGSNSSNKSESNPIRNLIELNNGKTPGKNLEDALNELDDLYRTLNLSDEDLLDRAERRDLPTAHQELRYHRFEHMDSTESLGTGSGTNYTNCSAGDTPRVRAPSTRRSAKPDAVSDDMANRRRLAFPDRKPLDPRVVVAKTGSYLARSAAFSPCTSPCPPEVAAPKHTFAFLGEDEPDVTLDDVSFRHIKRANAVRIIDPQPLFGIPLGPITSAPATDYLHSKPTESYRPIFGHLKHPNIVNDDIAFRNLRKDLGQDPSLAATKDWTPRLFSPNRETSFNYPQVKDSKKLRAIRSLSANITHVLPRNSAGSPTDFLQQQQNKQRYDIGKWNSYGDLHRHASVGSPSTRASTYLQPSWVEQIEKLQTSTETLTDHRNASGASRLATAILDPPEHWERKFPKKTVELTPPIYDPDKPRRPWTDIILDSFEKERQKEIERLAAEEAAAAAAAAAAIEANNKTEAKNELEKDELIADDDVFMEDSEQASKSETAVAEQVKISGNGSKNNDPESLQTRPNMDITSGSSAMLARPLPLLSGQKTRRGSWVEPSRSYSSSAAFNPSLHTDEAGAGAITTADSTVQTGIPSHQLDKRRKSWSDLPKDIDSFLSSTPKAIMLSGSTSSASPTRKLFNPLPPPKKIRQINLEAFNNNSNPSTATGAEQEYENEADQANNLSPTNGLNGAATTSQLQTNGDNGKGNSPLTPSTDKVTSSSGMKFQEEDELNELMDQLLKDADACGRSMEEDNGPAAAFTMKMNESVSIRGDDKGKSVSTLAESANVGTKEMKMDGETSSSEQSCKQDLSCMIVGMIPKQQSPTRDSNNASAPITTSARKELKSDNGNERGNVVSVPKALSSSDPLSILEGRGRNQEQPASSIEDLIESINETLPELEASCGGGGGNIIGMITSSSHSSDGKPNGNSSASGSPASSIPSPSPGSPTPPAVLSVSVLKKDIDRREAEKVDSRNDSSAFPVPAKRRHLPGKGTTEECLYENLPAATAMMTKMKHSGTGNDEKVCSSSTYPSSYKDAESESSKSDPYHVNKASKEKIPPLLTTAQAIGPSVQAIKRDAGTGRSALHDSNNDEDEDNEEEDTQHSSSHQPSSLSSNDSSDVSAASGVGSSSSPRENDKQQMEEHHHHQRQKNDNANANNNLRDNSNEDQVEQTGSSASPPFSSSLPSSVPFDAKTSSVSSFGTFANNQNNNQTSTTTTTPTSRRMSGSNSNASSTSSSSRETLFRKKSEAGTNEQEDKKMMKNSRSTRRESRSTRITRRSRSCAAGLTRTTTAATTTTSKAEGAILLDFREFGEKREIEQQEKQQKQQGEREKHKQDMNNNNNYQNQGFTRPGQLYGSYNITPNTTTSTATSSPADVLASSSPFVQTNSNFLNESESCPVFPKLSPGKSEHTLLGGMLSKRARRARIFQLSAPTAVDPHSEDEYDEGLVLTKHNQQQHTFDKNEKWQKLIEIMEESPLLVSPPRSVRSRTASTSSDASDLQIDIANGKVTNTEIDQLELRSLQVHPSEHPYDHNNCSSGSSSSKSKTSQQNIYSLQSKDHGLISQSQQAHQRHQRGTSNKCGLGRQGGASQDVRPHERETFIGNGGRRLASSSSPTSSSAAEEIGVTGSQAKKKEQQQQPVARSRTASSAAFSMQSSNVSEGAKKSATVTALASQAPPSTETSETGNGGMNFLRNNFPFFRNSTSRSRSQSVVSDVSRSSETGDSKRERDKSYRRKSHLNRAFTDEPVPDNSYTFDATTKSSKPTSHEASTAENSAMEENRANHKPAVKLHPAIPSVLTGTKSDNNASANKSISRNNSFNQNESVPRSPVPTHSHKSSRNSSFSDADQGVSFIKKMLQKESARDRAVAAGGNSQNCNSSLLASNIKKSPSAGNQSYWSKFSSSQSAFLRKLFEKPKVEESTTGNLGKAVQKTESASNCSKPSETCDGEKGESPAQENAESVLGFSVAQKASFFMKLEHEQRFSKWRKNSVDLGVISSTTTPTILDQTGETARLNSSTKSVNEIRSKARFLSRPITPSEGNCTGVAPSTCDNVEFGSLPRVWRSNLQQSMDKNAAASADKIYNNGTIANPTIVPTSSCTVYDDKEPESGGINQFIEILTRDFEPISPYTVEPTVKSYSLTRNGRHTGNVDKGHQSTLGSFPMYHSASAIINSTATAAPSSSTSGKHSSTKPSMKFHKNLGNAYSSSSSSFSEAMSRNNSTKYLPLATTNGMGSRDPPTVYENSISNNDDKRRGSASDLELSGAANQSPLLSRSEKVKSMFISRNRYHCDTDNLSEDGEVSSGGQEVADIICRSYENSPVFRKKNWRTPKHAQSNFTKEIWRRCGNYENWNHRPQQAHQQHQRQPQKHPVPQTFTATTNVIEVTTIPPTLPSVAASPPPATSNLLQILTVLSSSNDELNEPKPKSKKHYRQGSREKVSGTSSRADSIPPIHPNHTVIQPRVNTATFYATNTTSVKTPVQLSGNHRHTMPPTPIANSDEIFVSVPHPEDEAFQSFFCSVKSYTQITHFPPANGVILANPCLKTESEHGIQQQEYASNSMANGIDPAAGPNETLDISAVRRESDLLVMKKNVPTCKRKSTGGKYKNPLRALAARMDFRQQGYTQTHPTNTVHCSSDVDVST